MLSTIKHKLETFSRYQKAKHLIEKHERLLMPGALLVGVIIDFLTFKSLQVSTAFLILIIHFILALIAITVMRKHQARLFIGIDVLRYAKLIAPFIIQVTFGAMLSASLIFYWFSGALSVSWPLLLIVAFLMASNDVFRLHFLKPGVQLIVLYFIIFSLLTLMLPFLFNSVSVWVFILSGIVSLIFISMFIEFLSKRGLEVALKQAVKKAVVIIFVLMNGLYFADVIPPIPLSLRDAGAYHGVQRVGFGYELLTEDVSFIEQLLPGETLRITRYDPVYIFSAIFAPADLNTRIVHEWQWFDEEFDLWTDQGELSYNLYGGRQDGYRGFSRKTNLMEGKWRVDVQTESGKTLGRVRFRVKHVDETPELTSIIK